MFYYLLSPIMTYNIVLILSAVIPAIYLMVRVYRSDRLEKENVSFLKSLAKAGVFSSLIAMVLEKIFGTALSQVFSPDSTIYKVLLYFVVVAVSEEGAKYYMLKKNSWNSPEFNCLYDGVVYSVFISLGFALWENISYVLNFGFATAVVRAVTAIPGHASFGVFMGVFYAASKLYQVYGQPDHSMTCSMMAIILPVLLHGAYDYIATMETVSQNPLFIIFVALLFLSANYVINRVSRNDRFLI